MKTCYGYLLEAPRWGTSNEYPQQAPLRGTSNEYPQHMFLWRNKKNIDAFWWKKAPYHELCDFLFFFFFLVFIYFFFLWVWHNNFCDVFTLKDLGLLSQHSVCHACFYTQKIMLWLPYIYILPVYCRNTINCVELHLIILTGMNRPFINWKILIIFLFLDKNIYDWGWLRTWLQFKSTHFQNSEMCTTTENVLTTCAKAIADPEPGRTGEAGSRQCCSHALDASNPAQQTAEKKNDEVKLN